MHHVKLLCVHHWPVFSNCPALLFVISLSRTRVSHILFPDEVVTQWCQWGDKSQECGMEQGRVSVSTLSGVAALVYLSSACDCKWSQFDGSSHAPHKDISYSSHNAVIDVLEPAGRYGDDSTVPISSKHSDMLTEFLSLCWHHQYLTAPSTNHMWGSSNTVHGYSILSHPHLHGFNSEHLLHISHCAEKDNWGQRGRLSLWIRRL